MSKIGIVRDSISVNKPVKLENINKILTTVNKIQIHYTAGNFGSPNNSEVVILLVNPNTQAYTAAYIRERVLRWIGDGLASASALVLNDYLGEMVPTQVGVIGTQYTGQIIAAIDSAAACAATPNIDVAVDTNNAAPLIGTGIYLRSGNTPTGPVAAGNYALLLGSVQYFITVNSVSNISFVEICPLLLDFVYNLKNLTNPVTLPNPDAISFCMSGNNPGAPGTTSYNNFYNFTTPNTNTSPGMPDACNIFGQPNPEQITGNRNGMWPVGVINNATTNVPNFANEDVAFGVKLNDSNVANFQNAQLYISFDLNAKAGVVADATFVPFQIGYGQNPLFAGSPGGGVPGLGDGTTFFSPGNTDANTMEFLWSSSVFLPAGQSLVGSANFTTGAFCNWSKSQGLIQFVEESNCPQ